MLDFVICDDELPMLNRLCSLFETAFVKNDFNAHIALKTTNYKDVISFVEIHKVDVVILDIEFYNSKVNGLDVAKKIRESNKNCYIIFITSHFEYLMPAYKAKTFDYLIKNTIDINTVSSTLARLFDDINHITTKFLKIDNKGTFVDLNTVQFIEKNSVKLIYHTMHNDYETYNSFTKIQDQLPVNFIRCHKSYIANINNIAHVSAVNNSILFKNGTKCYIGPKYKNYFMEMINHDTILK